MTRSWFSKTLDGGNVPARATLAHLGSRPAATASSNWLTRLAAKHPLVIAAIAGVVLVALAVPELNGYAVPLASPPQAPKVGEAEYKQASDAVRRCLYQVDPESWAVRDDCLADRGAAGKRGMK